MVIDPNRVKEIFLEATERPEGAARVAYLDRACGGDAALRGRVEVLLRSHDSASGFLGTPAAALPGADHAATTEFDSSFTGAEPHITHRDEESEGLQFLGPSTRPGSLGRIGHYEVLEVLGKGGFGIVFRAFDDKLQRVVAVKMLSAQIASTSPARKRFLREARSSAKVRHENVVQIYAVEEQPLPYLVMEYIPGETLQQRLDRTGPLETVEALQIGRQIAEALAAAHAQGLIHRDVKPANILIEGSPNLHVKITDFGLARAVDDASVTQSGTIAGTPMFMAPEQAHGHALDHRADLFSLGSVLYTMCSGRPPFRANGTVAVLKRVVDDTPRPIREIIPEVPQWLCDIISRLHAKNPDDRISSAREVADLLSHGLAATQGPAEVPSFPVVAPVAVETPRPKEGKTLAETLEIAGLTPQRKPRPRFRRWVAVAAALLLVLGGFGFTEATGVTDVRGTVVRLFSPEGTLVVEVDDPGVSLKIDGSDIVITGAGAREIRLKPGNYRVEARKDGKVVSQELVTVTKNGRQVVRVSREAPPADAKVARPVEVATAWERSVAAMKAGEQVKAVGARLKELNPDFDGVLVPTIENGVVRRLEIHPDDVTDISPVRALTGLRSLNCTGNESPLTDLSPLSGLPLTTLVLGRGQLDDLSPLKGMPLTSLTTYETRVYDLSPLQGMRLRTLHIPATKVADISPLKGMPLETLDIGGTKVTDVTALNGMKLETLGLDNTKVASLSPLKGMPLKFLGIVGAPVSDLAPLKGMKLTNLNAGFTQVADLSPLNGMPLTHLNCIGTKVSDASLAQIKDCKDLVVLVLGDTSVSDAGLPHIAGFKTLKELTLVRTKVSDLTPLKDLPLEDICVTPRGITATGLDVLRNMKSLRTINIDYGVGWPTAEFWARYDKGEFR